ncbi:hypothetical protein IG631_13730 [Alternaria alternata]|nr:hypothetical protein IG631_13730 [Alternaria alternata]
MSASTRLAQPPCAPLSNSINPPTLVCSRLLPVLGQGLRLFLDASSLQVIVVSRAPCEMSHLPYHQASGAATQTPAISSSERLEFLRQRVNDSLALWLVYASATVPPTL